MAAGIVLLAVASSWVGFRNGFTYDDVYIIQKNPAAWKIRPDQKIVVKGDWPTAEDRLKAAERMTAALAKVATA